MKNPRHVAGGLGALALPLLVAACGGVSDEEFLASLAELPGELPVARPPSPVRNLDVCEAFSVEVDEALEGFGSAWLAGDREALLDALTPTFLGHPLDGLTVATEDELPLGARRIAYDTAASPVGPGTFADALLAARADLGAVEAVETGVVRGEFQPGRPDWGRVEVELRLLGRAGPARNGPRSRTARGAALVVQRGRTWYLHRLELASLEDLERDAPVFADVTDAAGLAAESGPCLTFGEAWSGAACGDVDGDGRWDLFVPSEERNRLYVAIESGGWDEEGARRGVAGSAGGTGAVFFDYDNDGDADLAVADEGYTGRDGEVVGNPFRIYRNEPSEDGWTLREATESLGLDAWMNSYTLSVLDHDLDGWLDVFVCNYGRHATSNNDSWTSATNGQANALFRNVEAKRFVDVADEAGLADVRWTYASSAADYDHDGDLDLYVANDFGRNALMRNDGDGAFTDVTKAATTGDLGFGMSVSWADLDNDGALDLYVSNMEHRVARRILGRLTLEDGGVPDVTKMALGNTLLLRRGDAFVPAPASAGGRDGHWAWGSQPLDVDLDGRLDLFCVNGFISRPGTGDAASLYWMEVIGTSIEAEREPSIGVRREIYGKAFRRGADEQVWREEKSFCGRERDRLWINRGLDAGFLDLSDVSGADSVNDGRAILAADFDDDGDPDLFVHESQLERHRLYRNDAPVADGSGFLKVRLRATTGQHEAVGAEVTVRGPHGPCTQILSLGSGFVSCQAPELVFGLGDAAEAAVEVRWPGGGVESFGDVAAGSRVLLVEGAGEPQAVAPVPHPLERAR